MRAMEMMAGDFSAKTRQIDFTRVDARGGDRIPRDNRNTANTAHKSPGEKIQTQRILCQNNTMGDHGNAVNTGHNLSPWRGWIHTTDKILVLDEILSERKRRGRKYLVDRIPVETMEERLDQKALPRYISLGGREM